MKKYTFKIACALCAGLAAVFVLASGCAKTEERKKSAAVFVPGIIEDSPIYATMVEGVKEAAAEFNAGKNDSEKVEVFVFEAGTNQAEWSNQLTSLVASEKYDVIFSSNPSLPELAKPLALQFPRQKFIFLDADCAGNESIATVSYKQNEAAFVTGYIAGLMTKTDKIGLISAQEYPVMNTVILPEYERGAKTSNPDVTVDFRIVGNWWDAKKGAELADAMSRRGVDVILPICGGASQGVIASAKENNLYLCWFDSNTYESAPGLVISCVVNMQKKLSREMALEFFEGNTNWGTAVSLGMKDGYIEFVDDDELYLKTVPEDVRKKVADLIQNILKK